VLLLKALFESFFYLFIRSTEASGYQMAVPIKEPGELMPKAHEHL